MLQFHTLGAAALISAAVVLGGCSARTLPSSFPAGSTSGGVEQLALLENQAVVRPRLYVSQASVGVLVYKQAGVNQSPVKTLTSGLSRPEGLFVNSNGDLYVANLAGQTVSVFKRGASVPYKTLNDPNEVPGDPVVDSDGTVYVCNYENRANGTVGPPGNVAVYAGGATNPTSTLPAPNGDWVLWCALDSAHNLYVGYTDNASDSNVEEFAGGSGAGKLLGLKIGFPGQMQFSGKGSLVIADERNYVVDTFKVPRTTPISSIKAPVSNPPIVGMALNLKSTHLYMSDYSTGQVYEFSYPQGVLIDTISPVGGVGDIEGLATDPPAPL